MTDRAEPEDLQGRAPNATAMAEPARVFVSYASPDAAVAGALVESLERHGIACWIAPRDVKGGALYADAIVRAISGAKALVLVQSVGAIGSSHVGREIERASSKKRPIIALRIDNAPLTPALEYFLSESQWIDAQAENKESAYARLIDAIREPELPAPGINPAATPSVRTASAGHSNVLRKRILLAAGLTVVAVAVAALLAGKFWLGKRIPTEQPKIAATNVVSDKSIAVLPFTDMSEKHDQEYFGDGMAEEILDLLTKIPGVSVIGRTSSFQFKGKNEDLRDIGMKLNAAYVLEGSVRKSGDQVRITAQLINTHTGTHEWSETYDRPIGDVLKLQDAIAAAVVRELQLTVIPGYLSSRSTVKNAEAYDLYLRARHAADRGDKEGNDEAVTLFQQSLDRDPTSANAEAELAGAYIGEAGIGTMTPAAGAEKARSAAVAAIKLDPNNVVAHDEMAEIHIRYDWDWAGAERELHQAATLAPGNVDVLSEQARLSFALGRWDDAYAQIKAALIEDPLDSGNLIILADIQVARGNMDEAEAANRRVLDIRPNRAYGHYNLGNVLLARGDRGGALREMQQETLEEGKLLGLALVYYALGKRTEADAALARLLKEYTNGGALDLAEIYAFRGESTEAMHWLDRAYAQKDPYLYFIKSDWLLKGLAVDPRYKAFLRKINLPE
jgi:TolB-like protein/tetratricopeptide (TPR) repeat protein